MNWYRIICAEEQLVPTQKLPSITDDWFSDIKPHTEVRRDVPQSRSVTLTLYRGFNVDLDKLQKSGNGYLLSPAKSEQGAMWFTHKLINGYDPLRYVTGRGSHLLTYPLQCIKHYQTVHYDDGSSYEEIPEEIQSQTDGLENCRFYRGYELPNGWFFSYKTEKFIICTIPIIVTADMIKTNIDEVE